MSTDATPEPSKANAQYNSIVGGVTEVVGNAVGSVSWSQSGAAQKRQGDEEYQAAQAKGYVEGTADRVGGKYDNVMGAITGDVEREISGKTQHDKGVAQQELNK